MIMAVVRSYKFQYVYFQIIESMIQALLIRVKKSLLARSMMLFIKLL